MAMMHGSCHCGAVSYDVEIDLGHLMTCNCSICGRTGAILAFVGPGAFTLRSGEDAVTDYQFGKRSVHHLFCKVCGVRAYGWGNDPQGQKTYAVNVRCLEGVDPHTLDPQKFDGRSL